MDLIEAKDFEYFNRRHPWELARSNVVKFLIRKNFQDLQKKESLSIIDIGCGDIFLLHKISLLFGIVKCFGIDSGFTNGFISLLGNYYNNFDITLYQSPNEIKVEEVELVLMLDVIEHIENEKDFIKKILTYKWVTNETSFFITAPSFQSLFCDHDKFLRHFRRYSSNNLRSTLQNAGLEVIKTGYFFNLLIYPRLAIKIIELINPTKNKAQKGIGKWKGSKYFSVVLIKILYIDFLICFYLNKIGIKLPGLSNYAICKKSV